MDFDLEALVDVEQTFYDSGYNDGFAHGRIHGLIEGRALGREKGFEMWEELSFYEGFALTWKITTESERAQNHIKHLLALIAQFPRTNPKPDSGDVDIPMLFRQIRSRYKALCSTLAVRPSLRSGSGDGDAGAEEEHAIAQDVKNKKNKSLWPTTQPQEQGLSF